MYKRVLVPLDGSMVAEAIVPVAVGLRASGVRVTTEVRRGDAVAEILAGHARGRRGHHRDDEGSGRGASGMGSRSVSHRQAQSVLIVEGGEP